jgi:hypothetical protein
MNTTKTTPAKKRGRPKLAKGELRCGTEIIRKGNENQRAKYALRLDTRHAQTSGRDSLIIL